jgi:hypothetical protein
MAKLTEWLRIMLGEIARKQEESARAAAEVQQRQSRQSAEHPGEKLSEKLSEKLVGSAAR